MAICQENYETYINAQLQTSRPFAQLVLLQNELHEQIDAVDLEVLRDVQAASGGENLAGDLGAVQMQKQIDLDLGQFDGN